MLKNVASQKVGAQMVSATDGSAFTGTVTVYVTGDAGTQAIGSVGSGICTHKGNGTHLYTPSAAETNYDHIIFTFIGTGAVPAASQLYTHDPAKINGPKTWYVAASGGSDSNSGLIRSLPLATPTQAQTNANAGDTIYLANGTYAPFGMSKAGISWVGQSRTSTIVSGNTPTLVTANSVSVRRMKFVITVDNSNPFTVNPNIVNATLEDCWFVGTQDGLYLRETIGAKVRRCRIDATWDALMCYEAANIDIDGCQFTTDGSNPALLNVDSGGLRLGNATGRISNSNVYSSRDSATGTGEIIGVDVGYNPDDVTHYRRAMVLDNVDVFVENLNASSTAPVYGYFGYTDSGVGKAVALTSFGGSIETRRANAGTVLDIDASVAGSRVRMYGTHTNRSKWSVHASSEVWLVEDDLTTPVEINVSVDD